MTRRSTEWIAGGAVFLLSFLLYLLTMAPDLTWGDSGELVTDVHTLGIPHPTGYPLYVLAGRVFSLIPIGSPAYRMNLFSGVCSALTVFVLFHVSLLLFKMPHRLKLAGGMSLSPSPQPSPSKGEGAFRAASPRGTGGINSQTLTIVSAALAALFLAVSPLFWSQATKTEVYAPASLLACLLLYTAVRCHVSGETRWLAIWSLCVGLAAVHHRLLVILFPITVLLVLPVFRKHLSLRLLGRTVFMLLVGLSPIFYLWLRGKAGPVLNWGGVDTFREVFWSLGGGFYREGLVNPLQAFSQPEGPPLRAIYQFLRPWFSFAFSQFGYAGLLAIIGIISWGERRAGLALLFAVTLLFAVLIPAFYQVGDKQDFFYLYSVLTMVAFAEGVRTGLHALQQRGFKLAIFCAVVVLLLALSSVGLSGHKLGDRSHDCGAVAYASGVFEAAGDARIIVTGIDLNENSRDNEIHTLWHEKYVRRPGAGPVILGANFLGHRWYDSLLREQGVAVPDWKHYVDRGEAAFIEDGIVRFTSRNNWVNGLTREVLLPSLKAGPVYSTGRSPGPWGEIQFHEIARIAVIPANAHQFQRRFLPSGRVYRLEPPVGKEPPNP
jgi:hypothetical protein